MDNDNYNDNYYEEFLPKKHGIVFRVFRAVVLFLVIIFCVFLIARIHINNHIPGEAQVLLWDETAITAAQSGDFFVTDHPLESYEIESGERVIRNAMTQDGYFSFSAVQYTTTGFQFTMRYNVSAAANLSDGASGEPFSFYLESDTGKIFDSYFYTSYSKSFLGKPRYEYRRLLFDGVDPTLFSTLSCIVMCGDKPVDKIVVYDAGYEKVFAPIQRKTEAPGALSDGLISAQSTIEDASADEEKK